MWSSLPNFLIQADAPISKICLKKEILDFHQAVRYVFELPYRRNSSKDDLTLVFFEKCGVCSTKHAVLAKLALENGFSKLKLVVGIYKMNERNTPGVGEVLEKHDLGFVPEAHTYLIFEKKRIDITREVEATESPFESLFLEKEIQPNQIGAFKVELHQEFLKKWLIEKKMKYSFEKIWEIREACIFALSKT